MFAIVLSVLFGVAIYWGVSRWTASPEKNRVLIVITSGYLLRLFLQTFVRNIPFFSHGVGGDHETYEKWARAIVLIWEHSGFEYITETQLFQLGQTSLPSNIFALIFWANGEPTRLGCTAVVAFAACLTCFNLHELALELGADSKSSLRVLVLTLFGPAFLMYTSDTYKDGLVALFVVGALGSAIRLTRRFSLLHIVIGVISLIALWHVRYYLIFVCAGPLVVGVSGFRSKSIVRPLITSLVVLGAVLFIASYTDALDRASETIGATFDTGTNEGAIDEKAAGGSGVRFDDGGSTFGALHWKILYTLFSPFPWQSGSLGLQVGKIDALIWYYLAYGAARGGHRLFKTDKTLLLMFLAFIGPTTVMYSLGMANIGLAVRERLTIVLVAACLTALRFPATASEKADDGSEQAEPSAADAPEPAEA